jgi:hypothetical protein
LALPVKTGEGGYAPFVVNLIICFFFQALVVIFEVELLQQTTEKMKEKLEEDGIKIQNQKFLNKGVSLFEMGILNS